MVTPRSPAGHDTRIRILDSAEALFIAQGYDAMSLRHVTTRAGANLAAVSYHFGGKEALLRAMLSRRLDPLNAQRLALLAHCQAAWTDGLRCEHVLGAMFAPALRLSREPRTGGPAFLRLLGRAHTDPAPFVRQYLEQHYAPVFERFFDAFAHALPALRRDELGWRLHFALQALSGMLAGNETEPLIQTFSQGRPLDDAHLLARLSSLIVATLEAPTPGPAQIDDFSAVLRLAESAHISGAPPTQPAAACAGPMAPPDRRALRITLGETR